MVHLELPWSVKKIASDGVDDKEWTRNCPTEIGVLWSLDTKVVSQAVFISLQATKPMMSIGPEYRINAVTCKVNQSFSKC